MSLQVKYFLLLSGCILSLCNPVSSQVKTIDLTHEWDTVRVLWNPYKGWYHHLLDNQGFVNLGIVSL